MLSSHVKISPLLWLHNKLHLSHQKLLKWNGLVFQWCLYNKKNITWPRGDTKFLFSCWKNISLVRCAHSWNVFQHLKRNFVSPRGHVISSIYYTVLTCHPWGIANWPLNRGWLFAITGLTKLIWEEKENEDSDKKNIHHPTKWLQSAAGVYFSQASIVMFTGDVHYQATTIFFSANGFRSQEFNLRRLCQHLTKLMSWNICNED